jgi:CubicO group peptidase (beta-lactamase class C family)
MTHRPYVRALSAALLVVSLAVPLAGDGARPWPSVSPEAAGFSPERLERLHARLRSYVDKGQHAGISMLIVRDGRLVDAQAWGHRDREANVPMQLDTIVRIYSMTVITVALMQLHEQALVRLDDPVGKYLPALAARQVFTGGTPQAPQVAPATRAIILKDLLTHTAGLAVLAHSDSPAPSSLIPRSSRSYVSGSSMGEGSAGSTSICWARCSSPGCDCGRREGARGGIRLVRGLDPRSLQRRGDVRPGRARRVPLARAETLTPRVRGIGP